MGLLVLVFLVLGLSVFLGLPSLGLLSLGLLSLGLLSLGLLSLGLLSSLGLPSLGLLSLCLPSLGSVSLNRIITFNLNYMSLINSPSSINFLLELTSSNRTLRMNNLSSSLVKVWANLSYNVLVFLTSFPLKGVKRLAAVRLGERMW